MTDKRRHAPATQSIVQSLLWRGLCVGVFTWLIEIYSNRLIGHMSMIDQLCGDD